MFMSSHKWELETEGAEVWRRGEQSFMMQEGRFWMPLLLFAEALAALRLQ
jgi:hypothetical protein